MKPNKFVNDVVNGYLSRDGTVAGARVRLVYFEGSKRDNQASKETGNISFQVFRVGSDITQESLSLGNDVFGKESDGLRNDCQGCCESDFESRDDGSNDLVDSIHPGDDGVERIRNVGGPGGKSNSGNLGTGDRGEFCEELVEDGINAVDGNVKSSRDTGYAFGNLRHQTING